MKTKMIGAGPLILSLGVVLIGLGLAGGFVWGIMGTTLTGRPFRYGVIEIYAGILLITGVLGASGIRTFRDYALGFSGYRTSTLAATLFATGIGGGSIVGVMGDTFRFGIIEIASCFMVCAKDLIIALCLAPVLARLLQHKAILSPGDIMQHYYGTGARVVTGIAGVIRCVGGVGAQIFAIQYACQHFLALPGPIGLLVGLAVVVAYTAYGGARAVVLTDVYQAILVFGLLPCFALGALKLVGGFGPLVQHLPPSLLSLPADSAVNWRFASMSIALVIPFLGPTVIQRCLMASGERQIRSAFMATAGLTAGLFVSVGICGLVAFALIPDCEPGKVFFRLTDLLFTPGTRSVACLALLAAVMSTADSSLNAASVTIVQDLIKPFAKRPLSDAQQLRYARWATLAVGLLGVVQVLRFRYILDLVVASFDCWGSTVLVPLYAGLFGLRASRKTFFGAVAAGQGMYWLWVFYLGQHSPLGSFIPSLLANALAFYLGWLRDGSPRGGSPSPQQHASAHPAAPTTTARLGGGL